MARETVTVRLDVTTRRKLAAVARPSKHLATEGESDDGTTPFDAIADLVGCVHGGDPQRSRRRSAEIADALRARRQTRRS